MMGQKVHPPFLKTIQKLSPTPTHHSTMTQFSPRQEEVAHLLTRELKRRGVFVQCASRYLREIANQLDEDSSAIDDESQSLAVELILQFLDRYHLLDQLSPSDIRDNPDLIQDALEKWLSESDKDDRDPIRTFLSLVSGNVKAGKDPLENIAALRDSFTIPRRKVTHPQLLSSNEEVSSGTLERYGFGKKTNQQQISPSRREILKGLTQKNEEKGELSPKHVKRNLSPSNSPNSGRASSPQRYTFGMKASPNTHENSPFSTPQKTKQKQTRSPAKATINDNGVIEVTPEPIRIKKSASPDKKQNVNIELKVHVSRKPIPGSPGGRDQPSVMVSPSKTVRKRIDDNHSSSVEVIQEEIIAYIPRKISSPRYADLPDVIKASESNSTKKGNKKKFKEVSSDNSEDSKRNRSKVMQVLNDIHQTSPRLPKMEDGFSNGFSSSSEDHSPKKTKKSNKPKKGNNKQSPIKGKIQTRGAVISPGKVGTQALSPSKIKKMKYADNITQTANNVGIQTTDEPPSVLNITVVEAEIPNPSKNVSCVVRMNDGKTKSTKEVPPTTRPKWGSSLTFRSLHIFTDIVKVNVSNGGEVEIPMKKIALDEDIDQWFELSPRGSGRIHLLLSAAVGYSSTPNDKKISDDEYYSDSPH